MDSTAIDRRQFCTSALGGVASLGLAGLTADVAAETPDRRPNILLIVAEDMGPHVGCYGDRTAPTPNLDRLARKGVRFRNAYVTQASCSPSRSSILTGLYPHQNFQLGLAHCGYRMHRGIPNIPSILKQRGYRTGIIGKLHVSPAKDFPFDANLGKHSKDVRLYAERVEAFLKEAGDRPFFLMVNYADAHRPFSHQHNGVPERPVGRDDVRPFPEHGEADTPEIRDEAAGYYNAVQRVDVGAGWILDALARTGKADSTLVIFITDHGPPFTRGKTTTYELGVRIPFLVRWPGHMKAALESDALVSTIDILPTCLGAAGLPPSAYLPGRSLLPLLEGRATDWRTAVCTEWNTHGPGFKPQRAIRDERYKLILNLRPDVPQDGLGVDGCKVWRTVQDAKYDGADIKRVCQQIRKPPPVELYDLAEDPREYHNLAGEPEYRAVQGRLTAELAAWRQATSDPTLDAAFVERLKRHHEEYRKRLAEARKPKGKRLRLPVDMSAFQRDWTPPDR